MPEPTTPKRRKARRNFARELSDLESYCTVSLEILLESAATDTSEYIQGQIKAFHKIIAKIGGTNGRS